MNIRDLVAQGLSNSEIAARLGVHPSTITRRLQAQGLTNAPTRPDITQRRIRIERLRDAGLTVAEIAAAEHISPWVVCWDLRHLTETNKGPGQNDKPA
jgi:DNA-binding CsgD family transcriptional regulator